MKKTQALNCRSPSSQFYILLRIWAIDTTSEPQIPCPYNGYKEMHFAIGSRTYDPWTRAKESPVLGLALGGHRIFRAKGTCLSSAFPLLDLTPGAQNPGIPCPNSPEPTSRLCKDLCLGSICLRVDSTPGQSTSPDGTAKGQQFAR